MRNNKLIIATILIFLLLFSSLSSYAVEYPSEGMANASSVRVRSNSSTSASQIATLNKGESVTVLEEVSKQNGDIWYKVKTVKGKEGYVLSDYLSIPETGLIQAAQNSPEATLVDLKITASCSNYNSVGKDWTHYYEWNGIQVSNDQKDKPEIFVAPNVELSLYARIREQDSKPDTSTEKTIYIPTAEDMIKGFTVTQEITVTEGSGRFKGNSALWIVKYTFTPIEK